MQENVTVSSSYSLSSSLYYHYLILVTNIIINIIFSHPKACCTSHISRIGGKSPVVGQRENSSETFVVVVVATVLPQVAK